MKKLITFFATISLTTSSLVGASAWTKTEQKQTATDETAATIAKKLEGKTINLDASFWVGKSIVNYKQQLQTIIVEQGILTQDEVQYVSWGELTFTKATAYPKCSFTVSKDGQTVTASNITLNLVSKAQYIADKLTNKTINFDLKQWYDKTINDNLSLLRENIVKQGILTQNEAQDVQKVSYGDEIKKPANIKNVILNVAADTTTAKANNVTLNIFDQKTAAQIAQQLNGKTIMLDGDFWDGKRPAENWEAFKNVLVKEGLIEPYQKQYIGDIDYVGFPVLKQGHVYQDYPIRVHKDGKEAAPTVDLKVTIDNLAKYIADKLTNKIINLDLKQWYDKTINDNLPLLRENIVQQGILTKEEAQDLSNGSLTSKIMKAELLPNNLFYIVNQEQVAIATKVTINIVDQ